MVVLVTLDERLNRRSLWLGYGSRTMNNKRKQMGILWLPFNAPSIGTWFWILVLDWLVHIDCSWLWCSGAFERGSLDRAGIATAVGTLQEDRQYHIHSQMRKMWRPDMHGMPHKRSIGRRLTFPMDFISSPVCNPLQWTATAAFHHSRYFSMLNAN